MSKIPQDVPRVIKAYLADCQGRSVSKETIGVYRSTLLEMEKFCRKVGIKPAKMSAASVEMFAAELTERGLARSSVYVAKCIVKKFLKSLGVAFPRYPEKIKVLLEGCAQKGLARRTIAGYGSTLLKAKAFFDKMNVQFEAVTADQLESFGNELRGGGLTEAAVETHISRFDRLFRIDSIKIRRTKRSAEVKAFLKTKKASAKEIPTVDLVREIEDYLDHCKKKNFNRGTLSNYRTRLYQAKKFFDTIGVELASVTGLHANRFVIHLLESGLANDTVVSTLSTLHQFLQFRGNSKIRKVFNQVTEILEKNPFRSASPSLAELPALLKEVDSCGKQKNIAIFYVLFEMGIPVTELCTLMASDLELGFGDGFDFKEWNGEISGAAKLRIRGTYFDRTMPVPARAELAVLNYLASRPAIEKTSLYLFPNQKGKATIPMVVYRKMKRLFKNIKTGKKGSRGVRHAHIRELFQRETDFRMIWALSGYKKSASVERHKTSKVVPVGSIYRRTHPRA